MDPGPQTIIAAGQTQAPGFGSIIMIGTSQFCHAAERMVYLRRRLQPVHSRHFLLTSLLNKGSGYMENPLRQSFFRAGHAHAGVIVVLSLLCQMLADSAVLPVPLLWLLRVGVPLSAILISVRCCLQPPLKPGGAISLIYIGAVILAVGVITLGIGLLRFSQPN